MKKWQPQNAGMFACKFSTAAIAPGPLPVQILHCKFCLIRNWHCEQSDTVRLWLCLYTEADCVGARMSSSSRGMLETILVVEDHSALLKFVKHVLEDAGYTVIAAASPKEALRLEAEFPGTIDLLLSDVRMKGMSGPVL